ncbi:MULTISPECIES: MBL fold metallo-hydrolase [unclassified Rhizobium]|uniref:MBL fold metallo-hydrolase n=1 Tax=unclassified Rhizobium TaxID=2613769 RepID=UPI00146CAB42|nr:MULTISPECIES: MBL fold metallo-hydrolase [unclassified Rhizobium]MBD9455060.1 MBL fold metallo-hydrolase [Rhizobium sp. RHZ02]NMN72017.1 L-ascorbate metabolism protein UlaG (beta-lactamase superfamily) [Rhizobium sp. 57MFTsu3.2]
MKPRFLVFAIACLMVLVAAEAAAAQEEQRNVSQCQAIAQSIPQATFASFTGPSPIIGAGATDQSVALTYIGHSTFLIETPGGVTIATDYSGWYSPPQAPMVVTMNRAHSSHYTLVTDPAIKYVLHGWSDVPGEKAKINLVVGDTYIRNVTTDIRGGFGAPQEDGNSIFIFEVAGLCIGHLGHLHYELTEAHYTDIGRLDVVMVPVDGGLTMGSDSMSRVIKRLRASLILPMHQPRPLQSFLSMFGPDFDISYAPTNTISVSLRALPKKPLIYVAKGMQ